MAPSISFDGLMVASTNISRIPILSKVDVPIVNLVSKVIRVGQFSEIMR